MILQCISVPDHWKDDTGQPLSEFPFKIGERYEVVEIFERQGHVMARPVGSTLWPKPGDPMFCWHIEEVFEVCREPLEIVSCGYRYVEGDDFFSVEITDPEHVALLRAVDELEGPKWEESFEQWTQRIQSPLPFHVLKAWYEVRNGNQYEFTPRIWLHDDVYRPEERRGPCVSVGVDDTQCPNCEERNRDQMTQAIQRFLGELKVPCGRPEISFWWYWAGTGGPRVIDCRAENAASWISKG